LFFTGKPVIPKTSRHTYSAGEEKQTNWLKETNHAWNHLSLSQKKVCSSIEMAQVCASFDQRTSFNYIKNYYTKKSENRQYIN
jgi:hypothetical protein